MYFAIDYMRNVGLSIPQVRSILELSSALAREPGVLALQLQKLAEGLRPLVSASAAVACAVESGSENTECVILCGSRIADPKTVSRWLGRLSRGHESGTRTIRGDRLAHAGFLGFPDASDESLLVSCSARRTAYCFRREPRRVISLALFRSDNADQFSTCDLATIDLVVGSGWIPAEHRSIPPTASMRQMQLLDLLKAGQTEKQAARQLRMSVHTVHAHVRKIYQRYGVASRNELLSLWIR